MNQTRQPFRWHRSHLSTRRSCNSTTVKNQVQQFNCQAQVSMSSLNLQREEAVTTIRRTRYRRNGHEHLDRILYICRHYKKSALESPSFEHQVPQYKTILLHCGVLIVRAVENTTLDSIIRIHQTTKGTFRDRLGIDIRASSRTFSNVALC